MEQVQLCSLEKVQQLMLIYVLVDQFLAKLHEQALEVGQLLHTFLTAFVQGAQPKNWNAIFSSSKGVSALPFHLPSSAYF